MIIIKGEIMKLNYIGKDDWDRPVYKDEDVTLWKDIGMNSVHLDNGKKVDKSALHTSTSNAFDGEPNISMNNIKKYNDAEIVLCFDEVEKPSIYEFEYTLLSRLKMDCDYYLSYGNRYDKHLWAGNVDGQIQKMKELYNVFTEDQKPEWLTFEQILQYEKEMQ